MVHIKKNLKKKFFYNTGLQFFKKKQQNAFLLRSLKANKIFFRSLNQRTDKIRPLLTEAEVGDPGPYFVLLSKSLEGFLRGLGTPTGVFPWSTVKTTELQYK